MGFSGTKKQFYSDLSAFQYSKFLGRCDFILFVKKTSISANLFTPKQKLRFNCDLCGSLVNQTFEDKKAVFFRCFHHPIFKFLGRCDFISFLKKTSISANLFTPKQKLTFNCVLCSSLVNRIFEDKKAVLFRSFRHPIFQIRRML
jgi:ribosomal protein L44E